MNTEEFDLLLKQALEASMEEDTQQLLEQAEALPEFPASRRFTQRMKQLLKAPKKQLRPRWQKHLQHAAAVLLALGLSAAVLLSSPQVRAALARVIRTDKATHTQFEFYGSADGITLPDLAPAWLPEGYELVSEVKTSRSKTIRYESSEHFIQLRYFLMESGTSFGIDSEHFSEQPILLDKIECLQYTNSDNPDYLILTWCSEDESVFYSLSGSCGFDKLERVFFSISEKK